MVAEIYRNQVLLIDNKRKKLLMKELILRYQGRKMRIQLLWKKENISLSPIFTLKSKIKLEKLYLALERDSYVYTKYVLTVIKTQNRNYVLRTPTYGRSVDFKIYGVYSITRYKVLEHKLVFH